MYLKTALYQIISYNKTIFAENLSNIDNIPDNETSPYISEENENQGYLYLLIIDLLIFASLTYFSYITSKRAEIEETKRVKPSDENYTEPFQLYFFKWLVIANALRSLSLIFIIIISNPNGNNGVSWVNSILHVVPAFVFVTCYIYLTLLLSEEYYKKIDYKSLILRPLLTIMINSSYFFLAIIAIITLFVRAFKAFFYISELLMALLYLVLGSTIIYFGKKFSEVLKDRNNYENMAYNKNLRILFFSIGSLFLLKGISGILEGIGAYSPPNHNVFDFFWFLILEILPTIILLYGGQNLKEFNNTNDISRNSTLNENDVASQRSTSYRPPFEN